MKVYYNEWRKEMLDYPRKSRAVQHLQYVRHRTALSKEDETSLYRGLQGFEGEWKFATLLEQKLQKAYIVLHDILLEQGNSHFQMDCLIIHDSAIYLLDIKNFQGDYVYKDNQLYNLHSKKKIKNPFHQIQRCEDLFREFLYTHKLSYTIHSHIIFNHPSFTLYQAPVLPNMILPTQIERFIQKLNDQSVYQTSKEGQLVETIYCEHIANNFFDNIPSY